MSSNRRLGLVAMVQLLCNVTGLALALRRRHAFDVSFMQGDPGRIGRQSILFGTAFSAPIVFLIPQGIASMRLVRVPDRTATRLVQALGATYVGGYLAERRVRQCLSRGGWDPVESPVALAGLGLSGLMFLLARAEIEPGGKACRGAGR